MCAPVTPRTRRIGMAASALVLMISAAAALPAAAQAGRGGGGGGGGRGGADQIASVDDRVAGFKKLDGFVPLYWDEAGGRLWMEMPKLNTEVLYSTGIAAGLGSNDIGIDRGALAGSRIIKFERVGPRILVVQPNYRYRAMTANQAEIHAVRDGFARSVIWSFPIAAATGDRLLVDATEFLVRDSSEMAGRLQPGAYRFEPNRSSIYMPMTQNFPKNTEMEVELTFVRQPGAGGRRARRAWRRRFEGVPDVAATPEAASIRMHHSIVELPDGNYKPRAYDPRSGLRRHVVRELLGAARHRDDASASSVVIAWRRRIRPPRSASRSSRSSTTSIPARPSRSARRCSTARDGGTRRSKRPATATRSASRCCPKASARSTSATTSSTGCTVRRAAGAPAAASPIRAPAKSSRASSSSARCAPSRTT